MNIIPPDRIPGAVSTIEHFIELAKRADDDEVAHRELDGYLSRVLMVAEGVCLPKAAFMSAVTNGRLPDAITEAEGWLRYLASKTPQPEVVAPAPKPKKRQTVKP
jgi:hypothetical protein